MKEKFEYKYEAPSLEERKEIDSIRNQYLPKNEVSSKLDRLKELHHKVNSTPVIYSLTLGVVGTLLFGFCMCFFLVENWSSNWFIGIPFGIIGIVLIVIAYPVHKRVLNKLKAKYSNEIIKLSDELLNEEKD